jgi:hypothetical protein
MKRPLLRRFEFWIVTGILWNAFFYLCRFPLSSIIYLFGIAMIIYGSFLLLFTLLTKKG